ncbi:MAG: zeta toxin family protein, partial [Fidelibacterota bacterium]
MIGDKIIVKEKHRQAADKLFSVLNAIYNEGDKKLTIGIGGESGSGKSELAVALKELFLGNGISCVILQQDDYFNFPPKTNAVMRRENIELVGPGEVNLGLLDHHLIQFKNRT